MDNLYKIKELEKKLIEDKEGSESLTYIKMMTETRNLLDIIPGRKNSKEQKEKEINTSKIYFTKIADGIRNEFGVNVDFQTVGEWKES